ncbi:phosphatase and actin regulator 2 isoform 5-T5 [Discoglossus pictus]
MGQTSVSTLSEQASSVDGLDKASIANSDAPNSGNQTPPLKRKGRLSSIGKIFKPWKWRKKKASEKFRETSAVLERKISMRQSREELIRRGVLKEIPDRDVDIPVSVGASNGHTVPISEEPSREEKPTAGNGSIVSKTAELEEKAEDKRERFLAKPEALPSTVPPQPKPKKNNLPSKNVVAAGSHKKIDATAKQSAASAGKQPPALLPKPTNRAFPRSAVASSSNNKKTAVMKTSSATPATSSSRAKPSSSKELVSSKPGSSSIQRAKKVPSRTLSGSSDGTPQPSSSHTVNTLSQKKTERTEQPSQNVDSRIKERGQKEPAVTEQQQKPQPTSPALNHELKVSSSTLEPAQASSKAPHVVTICDISQLPEPDEECKISSQAEERPSVSEEASESTLPLECQEDSSSLISQEVTDDASDTSTNPDVDREGKENHTSDSDSDGPILYTDDDDDDDDSTESSLASKIRRRDTLAIKLGNRPSKKDLEDKNILPRTSEEERQELRQQIGTKLVRRLSQRPTTEELEQRNILRHKNEEEEQEARRELKRRLTRKLSLRPSVAELQARRILRFNEYVEVTDSLDYDRRADKPWARLTPADKAAIRKELNEFKSTEMEVHEESRQFTRFHRP